MMNGSWQWTSRGTDGKQRGGWTRGFTLIELLVVIAVIALLISLILPSLGAARKTTWNVLCQNLLRQQGLAIQSYLDEQKDPIFPKLDDSGQFYQVRMVDVLNPYLSNAGSVAFTCPAAQGLASVRAPQNITFLGGGGRFYTEPFFNPGGQLPVTKWTEYWFNDSQANNGPSTFKIPHGVSGQRTRYMKWPQFIVWATDAPDEFPRHRGPKGISRSANSNTRIENTGKNNFLFADQGIKQIEVVDYLEGSDPVGSIEKFYNWGHVYPR
jgi:prepilin-type N-terminal cleavage/methylation domain-containing protein